MPAPASRTIAATPVAHLRELLHRVPDSQPPDIEALLHCWQKPVPLRRGDFLIQEGQTDHYLYFIKEGILRIFLPTAHEEICVGFGYASTLICSFPSFVEGRSSAYSIQALESCHLLAIKKPRCTRCSVAF